MPGAILATSRLADGNDRIQATWTVQNLTQPVPVPALTARQVEQAGGPEVYLRRGFYETLINLAKDFVTDIIVTRREPTGTPQYYNALAKEGGLPSATGNVSQEDMDRMRQRDRFTPAYYNRLAELEEVAMYREWAASEAAKVEQTYRTNELMEKGVLLMSGALSTVTESKLNSTAGRVN